MTDEATLVELAADVAPGEPPPLRVLLTCGTGDFIAMASYMTEAERANVEAIYWATRAREVIAPLVPFVFPNVVEHVVARDTWGAPFTDDFCISSRDQLPDLPPEVVDWSVKTFIPEIMSGARPYRGSPLVDRMLVDPFEKWPLPDRYIAVHPFSVNAPTLERDFTAAEWMAVQRYAVREGMPIVIVNKGGEKMRDQFGVCDDLSDMCDVLESIEIVKRAAAFVGCSSFLASIAAKTLDAQALFVKANWSVKRFYYWLYYAPQETNSFITDDLRKILPHA